MVGHVFAGLPVSDIRASCAWYGRLMGRPPDLVPNEKEAALLSGGGTPADFFAFARKLQMRSGILKLGARGAMSDVVGAEFCYSTR